ncbi:MAG: O-antigen ligase family protein [bacterium]|nr:O-antigen ligase family protein [bacterium]
MLFLGISLATVFLGDVKLGVKLSLLCFFVIAGLISSDYPKWQLLLYLLTIPFSSAVVLFTPFYRNFSGFFVETANFYAPYNSLARPDGLYIYSFMEFLILINIIYYVASRKPVKFRGALFFLILFVISNFFTILTAINPMRTFFQSLHLGLSLAVFFFSLQFWDDAKYEDITIILLVLLILFTVIDVIDFRALRMLMSGKWLARSAGRFNSPNPPAFLAGMGIIFSLYLGFKKRVPFNFFFLGIACILILVIFCTGSRNGLISSLVASFVFLIFVFKSDEKHKWILFTILGTVFLFIFYRLGRILFQFRLNPKLLLYDTSILSRILLWRNSLRYFISNPFSPVGTGNFFYFEGSLGLPFAHNFLINLLIESGVVAFLVVFLAYIVGIKKILEKFFEFLKSSEVKKEEIVSVAFILYVIMLFSADQFLYDGSLWRFMLIFLSFSISKLWRDKREELTP